MTNILLVSNDFGSTCHNVELYKYLKKNKSSLKPKLVASKHSAIYIKENQLKPIKIIDSNKNTSKKEIIKFIKKNNIKFLVTGLSVDYKNIDSLFLGIAREIGINSGVIQDYWGYIGDLKKNNFPNVMWVFDDLARNLTSINKDLIKIKITGSVKHSKKLKSKYDINKRKKYKNSILIIGQPYHISGIKEFYENVTLCFKEMPSTLKFYFKEHPADKKSFSFIKKKFRKNKIRNIEIVKNINDHIKYCDITLSCYSSVGIDHAYMNYISDKPLGSFFNITIGPKIKNTIKKYVNSVELPTSVIGVNKQIKYKKDLQIIRNEFFFPKIQNIQFRNAKKYFFYKKNPCKKIEEDIKHIVNLNT